MDHQGAARQGGERDQVKLIRRVIQASTSSSSKATVTVWQPVYTRSSR